MTFAVGGILELDQAAGNLFGPGWFLTLGWTGAAWRWGRQFQAGSTGAAMGTMRLALVPGERVYLYRWIPTEGRWGRVA